MFTRNQVARLAGILIGVGVAGAAHSYALTYNTLPVTNSVFGYATGVAGTTVVGYETTASNVIGYTESVSGTGYTSIQATSLSAASTFPLGTDGTTIVGRYQESGTFSNYGFTLVGSTFTKLYDPNASTLYGTFAQGVYGTNVVGYYKDGSLVSHGFTCTTSGTSYATVDCPLTGATATKLEAISSTGTIVGNFTDAAGTHGFEKIGTVWTPIDDPLAVNGTYATGISGTTIIGYYKDTNSNAHGFAYDGTTFTPLDFAHAGVSGVDDTYPLGISGNTVVGYYNATVPSSTDYAFTTSLPSVPEPASLGLIALAGTTLLARRRKA